MRAEETFAVYCAGEQIDGVDGVTYIYVTSPRGQVRMTEDEAEELGKKLIAAAAYNRALELDDESAVGKDGRPAVSRGVGLHPPARRLRVQHLRTARRIRTLPRTRTQGADAMSDLPEPTVRPVEYVVNCLPEGDLDSHVFGLTVAYRGRGLWAVLRHGNCLRATGEWDYEMRPSSRGDEWLAAHRFDLDTALKLAREAAPHVTVNGYTVADALRMRAQRQDQP